MDSGDPTGPGRRGDPGPRTGARLTLLVGVLFGLAHLSWALAAPADLLALDFEVYYYGDRAVLDGGPLYGVSPVDVDRLVYAYPPLTVLAFLPFSFLTPLPAFLVFTALTVGAGLLAARLVLAYLDRYGRPLDRGDRILVYAFATLSVHAMPANVYGQVNLPLALGTAGTTDDT